MAGELLLGIDVGTSSVKAIVYDHGGREYPAAVQRTPWTESRNGAEMDAHQLAEAVVAAGREAIANGPGGRVSAVGVASLAETGVLLDRRGKPLGPMIAWFDERGADIDIPEFAAHTGLAPSRTPSISKHAWMGLTDVRRWMNVAEWVVKCLGGDEVAELSLSSRTGYLDLATRSWWTEALAWVKAPPGLMPTPVPAGTPAGRCSDVFGHTAKGAVLTVAGHDHLAAAIGAGATQPGDVIDSCGTAEALVRSIDPVLSESKIRAAVKNGLSIGWHVIPERQYVMAAFHAGKVLEGLGDLASPAAAAGLAALTGREALLLRKLEEFAGKTKRLVVTGGWARVPQVRAMKRSVLGRFEQPDFAEAGARGAALLAGVALDLHVSSA